MSPEQIVGAMLLELERHRGTAPQADDLTLVVIKKT
jgi:serine phosphatase RsbU (regulator of sigma subunit)